MYELCSHCASVTYRYARVARSSRIVSTREESQSIRLIPKAGYYYNIIL